MFKLSVNDEAGIAQDDYKKYLRGVYVELQNTSGPDYDPETDSICDAVKCEDLFAGVSEAEGNTEEF
jgi:hypothetical protein